MPSPSMIAMLEEEHHLAERTTTDGGADVSKPFFYLAGPMSNLPKFNFPRFLELAGILREQGYNICNPAEFEHEISRFIMAQPEGSGKQLTEALLAAGHEATTWADCLRRDIVYVGHDNCQGVILMENWQRSQGAQFETYVAYKLRKPIYELSFEDGNPTLTEINRREALDAAGVID